MLYEIALGIWRTFPLILLVFGTIGHLMTIIVLRQNKNRNSSIARYLSALAIADLIVLWTALPRNWLNNEYGIDLRPSSELICKMHIFLLYFGPEFSVSLVVIVTIERFISTWLPTRKKRICTTKIANIIIISSVATIVLLNSHILYGYGLVHPKNETGNIICYPIEESYAYFAFNIWSMITLLVFCLTPLVIMVFVNVSIVVRVLMMRRKTQSQVIPQTVTTTALARKAKDHQLTAMLITLNVVYMICVTPIFGFLVFYSDWVLARGNDHSDGILELIWAIVNALFYTNNAVNFILYFLSGSAFRKETKTYFCGKLHFCTNICRLNVHSPVRNVNVRAAEANIELQNIGVFNTFISPLPMVVNTNN